MKTRIYIDGYNFYYGCLKGTPFKWLDLVKLFSEHILPGAAPTGSVLHHHYGIKLFTADIVNKAAISSDSVRDQKSYHRALTFHHNSHCLEIIKGYYSVTKTSAYAVENNTPEQEPKYCPRVKIWKLEEKQSDVNMAITALYDAMTDKDLQQIVFVTNDTDLAPALQKIAALGGIKIGLVIPTKAGIRNPNKELVKYANWTKSHITDEELRTAQLPRVIEGLRKPAIKPASWFGQPGIVDEIMAVLLPVYGGKRNKCWHWLESDKPKLEDLPLLADLPINLLDDEKTAMDVLQHAKAFACYQQMSMINSAP